MSCMLQGLDHTPLHTILDEVCGGEVGVGGVGGAGVWLCGSAVRDHLRLLAPHVMPGMG